MMNVSQPRKPLARVVSSEHTSFPTREDGLNLIEVHVAGVCIRTHAGGWQVLAARRAPTRSLFPGKWECGGGMVRAGEGFDAAIRRQMFEEFGLKVERVKTVEIYEIPIPRGQRVIPGIRFLCVANDGKVRLNRREFSSYRWIDLPVRERLDWIPGLKEMISGLTEELPRSTAPPTSSPARAIGFQAGGVS